MTPPISDGISRAAIPPLLPPFSEDPFEGYFDREGPIPDGLDEARANARFDIVRSCARAGLYTYQRVLEGRSGTRVRVGGRTLLMLSSYDYLGLIGHPRIERAAVEAIQTFGTGTGGVRLLTGSNRLHHELEESFARFKGVESALAFTSGYLANVAAISALVGPQDTVVADERAHRSILDGGRLAHARLRTFRHNDLASAEEVLTNRRHGGRTLLVAEGIYSMDGDSCPLPGLVELKKRHGALLMIDEAHSFGVLGASGRGVDEHFGIPSGEVDLWSVSLSKAIPSSGGVLAGSRAIMIYLQHEAAPFMFSGALCPAATAASKAALEVMAAEPWRLERLRSNAAALRTGLRALGFNTEPNDSPVIPVVLGSEERTWTVARRLHDEGVYVTAVVHPAVPRGQARLRICAMASHTGDDYREALEAIARAAGR